MRYAGLLVVLIIFGLLLLKHTLAWEEFIIMTPIPFMKWKHKKEIEERFFKVKENKGDISWYLENSDLISYYDDTLDSIWHIGLRLYYFYNYFYKKHKRNKKESIIYQINSDLIDKFKTIDKFTLGNLSYNFRQSYISQNGKGIEVLMIGLMFSYIITTNTHRIKTLSFIYLG